jgi:hypothetical protein
MRVGVGLLALGAAWGFYRWWFPPDETQIRTLMRDAAQAVSWRADSGGLQKLGGVNRLTACCLPDVEIRIDVGVGGRRTVQGTEELRQLVLGARTAGTSLEVSLSDVAVEVSTPADTATAQFLATIRASNLSEPFLQEVRVLVRKRDGRWRIARVEPVRGFGM